MLSRKIFSYVIVFVLCSGGFHTNGIFALAVQSCSFSGLQKFSQSKSFPQYRCPFCLKLFFQFDRFVNHQETHGEGFECVVCRKKFGEKNELIEHNDTQHSNYQCTICGKSFLQRSLFKEHIRIHIVEKPYPNLYPSKSRAENYSQKLNLTETAS